MATWVMYAIILFKFIAETVGSRKEQVVVNISCRIIPCTKWYGNLINTWCFCVNFPVLSICYRYVSYFCFIPVSKTEALDRIQIRTYGRMQNLKVRLWMTLWYLVYFLKIPWQALTVATSSISAALDVTLATILIVLLYRFRTGLNRFVSSFDRRE